MDADRQIGDNRLGILKQSKQVNIYECLFYVSWYKLKKMEVVENEHDLLEQANNVATLGEFFAWLQRCDECIERLEERSCAKRPQLSIGNRQSLVVSIARLEGAKTRLQRRFIHFGVIIRVLTVVSRRDSFGEKLIPRSKIVYQCGD